MVSAEADSGQNCMPETLEKPPLKGEVAHASEPEGFRGTQNTILGSPGESVGTSFTDFPSESAYCNERRLRRGFSYRKAGTPQSALTGCQLSLALSTCTPQAATAAKPFRGAWGCSSDAVPLNGMQPVSLPVAAPHQSRFARQLLNQGMIATGNHFIERFAALCNTPGGSRGGTQLTIIWRNHHGKSVS